MTDPFDVLDATTPHQWELHDEGIELRYDADFLDQPSADRLFENLRNELKWHRPVFRLAHGTYPAPRLIAWHADEGLSYRYSGIEHPHQPWTEGLLEIQTRLRDATGVRFNGVLANLYENENDSVSYHSDDEKDLVSGAPIASVSLGHVRDFLVRHIAKKNRHSIPLGHGSLLVMSGDTQKVSQHSISKVKTPCGPRINLTFRSIQV